MIVKENLLDTSNITCTYASYDKDKKIAKVLKEYDYSRVQYKLPEGLEIGQKYTFSCCINNIDGDDKLAVCNYPNEGDKELLKADGAFQSYTFTLKDKNTHIYLYLGVAGSTKGTYKLNQEKLENGDQMTLYLPHKSNVKAENQAIFPSGGGITKSTLYRGYKGVSLC